MTQLEREARSTADLLVTVRLELATMRTKIGFASAIGSLVGGGVVAGIIALASGTG